MARAAKVKSINPEIDNMVKKLTASFDTMPPAEKINAIKVAVMWEKIKHSIKEGDEGDFFGNNSDDEE